MYTLLAPVYLWRQSIYTYSVTSSLYSHQPLDRWYTHWTMPFQTFFCFGFSHILLLYIVTSIYSSVCFKRGASTAIGIESYFLRTKLIVTYHQIRCHFLFTQTLEQILALMVSMSGIHILSCGSPWTSLNITWCDYDLLGCCTFYKLNFI